MSFCNQRSNVAPVDISFPSIAVEVMSWAITGQQRSSTANLVTSPMQEECSVARGGEAISISLREEHLTSTIAALSYWYNGQWHHFSQEWPPSFPNRLRPPYNDLRITFPKTTLTNWKGHVAARSAPFNLLKYLGEKMVAIEGALFSQPNKAAIVLDATDHNYMSFNFLPGKKTYLESWGKIKCL